jgi:hypothetical protein
MRCGGADAEDQRRGRDWPWGESGLTTTDRRYVLRCRYGLYVYRSADTACDFPSVNPPQRIGPPRNSERFKPRLVWMEAWTRRWTGERRILIITPLHHHAFAPSRLATAWACERSRVPCRPTNAVGHRSDRFKLSARGIVESQPISGGRLVDWSGSSEVEALGVVDAVVA